ncbi:PE family protein [Mycobacterium interjectum]|nr:PE family protein [Mycobacterium interjectum]MCV7088628.1 PE family protein [Mycobacterium interjectum]
MSFVIAAPEALIAAASDLGTIGSAIRAANAAAAAPTTQLAAAAADEVSAAIAALFSTHGRAYQAATVRASIFHGEFLQALAAGANSYAGAEAGIATAFTANPLQIAEQEAVASINAPILTLSSAR